MSNICQELYTKFMRRKTQKRWTKARLAGLGIPAVLIPGILLAVALGWNPTKLANVSNYHKIQTIFPESGVVSNVSDGDTFELKNGVVVRMLGIDAPNRGENNYNASRDYLRTAVEGKRVYLEYDRYQDDKYGRVLAWVWINCETTPEFLPVDYMRLTYNTSKPGLTDNPKGCKEGKLVNEEMVRRGLASVERYKERGELKYEERLKTR